MHRLIQQVRELWNPVYAPDAEEWEPNYHAEGWTEAGAFSLCIYQIAFDIAEPERTGPLCQAEENNQVLFRPVESLVHDIRSHMSELKPKHKIIQELASLQVAIQRVVDEALPSRADPIRLPEDYEASRHVTNHISGAGIPSELAGTVLIQSPSLDDAENILNPNADDWRASYFASGVRSTDHTPHAGWKMGGCTQHRDIYYVLCQEANEKASPLKWKIFDKNDVDVDVYETLAHFLGEQAKYIEQRPGGHQQEKLPLAERYPPEEGTSLL
ncbi:hypothetical protein CLAFUW4_14524 [Fulvia fulva]|uniref:Uncharacterized protein n=1 Tax=Passalora fulva TaxID=5499 RepID=A0A9Q8PM51_PASFU|nr:uncharacterized protein CLAFUR5_14355 [Fulvia fulva]KAK4609104.1 hypothetical protein CLAFUR4_14519 [Fulvia fulva]KAK4609711.1 hypothetical protein CLAFUR0_14519 [Fulvia fulva]UJO25154.1 hypothetical protein CLAFUR5_14355 [Fulvia fulva]WPV22490.1 hypothetical protein CLAFUW4_14524 [Fulvia fulva]WPV37851.1 hypothetical protein CLAFUW7_14528 [Fulvia fulva]